MDALSMIPGPVKKALINSLKKQLYKEGIKCVIIGHRAPGTETDDEAGDFDIQPYKEDILANNHQLKKENEKIKKRNEFLEKVYRESMK